MFSSADCNRAVASNEDDAVELTMYRQNGSRACVDPVPVSGASGPVGPLPDELGPAERGEAPPLREVKKKAAVFSMFTNISSTLSAEAHINQLVCFLHKLQISAKFSENHRFCNIKVRKCHISKYMKQPVVFGDS